MAMKSWDEGSDPYPIWGTCLGFELLALLAAEGQPNLASCLSVDQALALNLTQEFEERFYKFSYPDILTPFFKNHHHNILDLQ